MVSFILNDFERRSLACVCFQANNYAEYLFLCIFSPYLWQQFDHRNEGETDLSRASK